MAASNDLVPQDGAARGRAVGAPRREREDDMPPALLEFHSPSAAIAATPPSATAQYINWTISSMALATVMIMGLFPLSKVVPTSGALTSTAATIVVQPLESSIIKSIDVREGEVVHKGQVLAHLDPAMNKADLTNYSAQSDSFKAEIARLQAEVGGTDYKVDPSNPASTQQEAIFLRRKAQYQSRLQDFDQQIASLRSDVVGFEASAAMYAGRVKVAQDVHDMRLQLQRDQVGSRLNSLASQDELMETERSQINAQQSAQSARGKLSSQIAQRDTFIAAWKSEAYQTLTDDQRKLAEVTGSLSRADLQRSLLVMRADQDAVVLNIAKVSVGSVLTSAQQFMTLTPLNAPLEVVARLAANEAGYVKIGDKVQVKFAAFPYFQYGGADAVVTNVSSDAFSMETSQASAASAPANGLTTPDGKEAFYRVRMRITRYTLHNVPDSYKPTAGNIVTAEINVGKRTML
ncbi:MAG: HlyD family type I secretion periplasmic adaptor subunit, partial [Gluconacetobacter diazotrophicus]|nr:HlyD family type I secretion periplasmic adaptor subunit [Gluconacetobacter diazotrophicus]